MSWKTLLSITAMVGLLTVPAEFAMAQGMVSIKGKTVNLRAAPNLRAEVLWKLGSGFPLKVVRRQGDWLKVVDFERDQGWVATRLTATTPSFIVKSDRANLRAGPGTKYRVIGQATYGDVFRTLEKRKSWVRVEGEGGRKGWVARALLWGW